MTITVDRPQQEEPDEQGHHFELGDYRVATYRHTERFFAHPEDMPEPTLRHRIEQQP